jgi:hypothetical protein
VRRQLALSIGAAKLRALLNSSKLYLAVEDIDHSRTKTKSPQTNGICERLHKTALKEFTASPSAKRCIVQSMSCRPTCGSENTMNKGRISDAGALAKPRCGHKFPATTLSRMTIGSKSVASPCPDSFGTVF